MAASSWAASFAKHYKRKSIRSQRLSAPRMRARPLPIPLRLTTLVYCCFRRVSMSKRATYMSLFSRPRA